MSLRRDGEFSIAGQFEGGEKSLLSSRDYEELKRVLHDLVEQIPPEATPGQVDAACVSAVSYYTHLRHKRGYDTARGY